MIDQIDATDAELKATCARYEKLCSDFNTLAGHTRADEDAFDREDGILLNELMRAKPKTIEAHVERAACIVRAFDHQFADRSEFLFDNILMAIVRDLAKLAPAEPAMTTPAVTIPG